MRVDCGNSERKFQRSYELFDSSLDAQPLKHRRLMIKIDELVHSRKCV